MYVLDCVYAGDDGVGDRKDDVPVHHRDGDLQYFVARQSHSVFVFSAADTDVVAVDPCVVLLVAVAGDDVRFAGTDIEQKVL